MWRKRNPPTLLVGMWIGTTTMENSREVPEKKNKNGATIWPSNPVPRLYLEKTIIRKDISTPAFTAARFTIARTRKQSNCPRTEEWIKQMWYIYTLEHYSAIKRNELMPFAMTWIDLHIVIQSEVRKNKTNIIQYHLYVESWKIIQTNLFAKQK